MDAFAIAIILVSGFMFTTRYPVARFKQLRSKDWIQYLHIFAWGLGFSTLSFILEQLVYAIYILCSADHVSISQLWLGSAFDDTFSFLFFAWSCISVLLAWACGHWCSNQSKFINKGIAMCASEDAFKTKIYDSVATGFFLQITLENRKVYVGPVFSFLDLKSPESKYIRLFPIMSGYRDPNTLLINFLNKYDYWETYQKIFEETQSPKILANNIEDKLKERERLFSKMNQYAMVIPINSIISMANFDIEIFKKVNGNTTQ